MSELRKLLNAMQLAREVIGYAKRPGFTYQTAEQFVLQHGVAYPNQPWRMAYDQGPPKQCYGNSIIGAAWNPEWRYIEGFALAPAIPFPIPHAWNLDEAGNIVDRTWCNTGLDYLGVEFSVERADDATWNGDACILDDYRRKWPIFRHPWKGEDYTLAWEPSERLEIMRANDRERGLKWLQENKIA